MIITKIYKRVDNIFFPSVLCIFSRNEFRILIKCMCWDSYLFTRFSFDNIGNSIRSKDIPIKIKGSKGDMGVEEKGYCHISVVYFHMLLVLFVLEMGLKFAPFSIQNAYKTLQLFSFFIGCLHRIGLLI